MEGLKCKNEKKKIKNDLAKHGLNKHGIKDQNWSHFEGEQTVEEKEKRKREKKRKRKRRRRGEEKKPR